MRVRPWLPRPPALCLLLCTTVALGCLGNEESLSTTKSRALSYALPTSLVLPMYSSDDTDWQNLFNAVNTGNPWDHNTMYVIVNGSNNGPDDPSTTAGQTLIARITQLHNYGVQVIGYVNNATPGVYAAMNPPQPDKSHPAAESAREAQLWRNSYGTDGTFFDLSWRVGQDLNDTDLANAEGLAIATGWGCTTAMWNWSVPMPQAERYLQCIRMQVCDAQFMIEETDQAKWSMWYDYWDWIFSYSPTHFVDVVNASSVGSAPGDFDDMRHRAAEGFFVTDRTDYNHLPNDMSLFLANINHDNQSYSDFAGSDDPPDPTDCPPPTSF